MNEMQLATNSNAKRSIVNEIFVIAVVLTVTNIALNILSIVNYIPSKIMLVSTPVTIGISATLNIILVICAFVGLILIQCKKHNPGCKTVAVISVFCILLVSSYVFLCITTILFQTFNNASSELIKIITLIFEAIVIMAILYLLARLRTLISPLSLYAISERMNRRIPENIYEDITLLQARYRILQQPVALPVSRTNSVGTVYEEIPLSNVQSEESFVAYIDAFGSQEDMRTAMTNV